MKKSILKRGFTLIEVMIVVGVIVALTGIAIPTVSSLRKSLDTKQESNYAKDIYLAVQDHFTSQRTDGSLSGLVLKEYPSVYVDVEGEITEDTPRSLENAVKAFLPEEQQNDLITNDKNREYVWTTNENQEEFYSILPLISIDQSILDPNIPITVVFNEITGDVLYVKYGNDGEYAGSVVNLADKIQQKTEEKLIPVITIVNGQECYIKVSVPVHSSMTSKYIEFFNNITFTFTIRDATDNSKTYTCTCNAAEENPYFTYKLSASTCTARWTVDSLLYHFSEKTDNPIPAGDDIQAYVKCTYKDDIFVFGDSNTQKEEWTTSFNPLFDSVSADKTVIGIANGRQLQNLNYIDENIAQTIAASANAEIKLTSDIAWGDTYSYYENWFERYGSNSEYSQNVSKWLYFKSIEPSKLFATNSKVTLNGNSKKIINLYILDQTGKGAGLFRELYTTVSDLSFLDPVVVGTGDTGVIAGKAIGTSDKKAEIKNCSVKIESENRQVLSNTNEETTTTVYYGASGSNNDSSVGLFVGDAKYCEVTGGKIETTQNSTYIYTRVTASNYGLIAGNAENCTVYGTTISSAIHGGVSRNSVGAAIGKMKNSTIANVNVTGLLADIAAANLGGLVGCCDGGNTVTGCNFNGTITCKDGGSIETLGGLIGKATGGTYTGNSVSGKLQNISSYYFGGAMGCAFGGEYTNNHVTTGEMNVRYAWVLGNTGSTVNPELGVYACPSGTGYAGKFIGYIQSGKFDNCTAKIASTGVANDINYAGMQFVGVVNCVKTTISGANKFTRSSAETSEGDPGRIAAKMISSILFRATSIANTDFTPAEDVVSYTYDGISLSSCKYNDNNGTEKTQCIDTDKTFYFYTKNNEGKRLTGADTMSTGKYLIARPDGSGDYDILVVNKKVLSGSNLQNMWKSGQLYIADRDYTSSMDSQVEVSGAYEMYDSAADRTNCEFLMYFTVGGESVGNYWYHPMSYSKNRRDWGNENFRGVADNSKESIKSSNLVDVYRYVVTMVKAKRDLGIDLEGTVTAEQIERLQQYSWLWNQQSTSTDNNGTFYTGNLIFDSAGADAYMYLNASKISGSTQSQKVPVVIPYSDSLSKWFSTNAADGNLTPFLAFARVVDGKMMFYRAKGISASDRIATFDFNSTTTGVKWTSNNNYSQIKTDIIIFSVGAGLEDGYSFSRTPAQTTVHLTSK